MAQLKELFIPLSRDELDDLLEEWSWQTDGRFAPIALTAFGDWFLRADEGGLFFLDTGDGSLERIGDSREGLDEALADPDHRQTLLLEAQFDALSESGVSLEPGMCYSWKVAPCLGGDVGIDNLEPSPVEVHQCSTSQIARSVQDMPVEDAEPTTVKEIALAVAALLVVPSLVGVYLLLSGQL